MTPMLTHLYVGLPRGSNLVILTLVISNLQIKLYVAFF